MDNLDAREFAKKKLTDIIVEHLKTGESLPTETKLIEELKISRTMLRELLSYYEASGIITSRRGSGRFANIPDISEQIVLSWRILIRANPELLMEFFAIRYLLEINTLPDSIQSLTFEQIKYLNEQIKVMKQKAQRGESFVEQEANFHKTLFQSTHNMLLEQLLVSFWKLFDDSSITKEHDDLIRVAEQHAKMLEAFTKKDMELSDKLMKEHFADARLRITLFLTEDSDKVIEKLEGENSLL